MTSVDEADSTAAGRVGAALSSPPARLRVGLRTTASDVGGGLVAPHSEEIDAALLRILATLSALLGADGAALLLPDREGGRLHLCCRYGPLAPDADRLVPGARRDPSLDRLLDGRGSSAVGDLRVQPELRALTIRLGFSAAQAMCAAPLRTFLGESLGSVLLVFAAPRAFRAQELQVLEISAGHAAELMERARSHEGAARLAEREHRRGAQLRQLAEAALAISREADVDEILRLVTEAARAIIGTHQGVTSRLMHGWSHASTFVSLSDKYAAWRGYDRVPTGLGVLNAVTRENRPLRLTGAQLARHPEWRGLCDAPDHPPLPDYLAAPLIARDGSNLGLIQLSDKEDGSSFSEEDEAMLVQLAQMASIGIENAELLKRERDARREAEEQARRRGMLSDASAAFATSLDLDQVLDAVTGLLVPAIADWCGITLLRDDGELELMAEASVSEALRRSLWALGDRLRPRLDRPHGVGAVVRTGRSEFFPQVPREVFEAVAASAGVPTRDLLGMGIESGIVVPLPAGGRVIGALTLVRSRAEPFTNEDLEFAEDLGQRAALAIDNAARYTQERQTADVLQRSLLPQVLPALAGLRAAARYRPGGAGTRIGGDWYDIITLDPERIAVVVGDVMGRGAGAATVMGQLRAAVRAYAVEGHEPAVLLERLDALVERMDELELTTSVYGVYDRRTGGFTVSCAGHPPPLLVAGGRAEFLPVEAGLPLGAGALDGGSRTQSVHPLGPGATLLLYTDGLVEGRDSPVGTGMRQLAQAATRASDDPETLCDELLRALGREGHHRDDTALLALRVDRGVLEWTLRDGPASLAWARGAVRSAAQSLGAADPDAAALAAHELAANALLHGGAPVGLRLDCDGRRLLVEVGDGSGKPPLPQRYRLEAATGRGLSLVEALVDRWGWRRHGDGKVVWCEVRA